MVDQFSILSFVEQLQKQIESENPQCSIVANAVVKLYVTNNKVQWISQNIGGMLTLQIDRKYKSNFFRLFDLNTLELLFEFEIYYDFELQKSSNNKFAWFEIPGALIGFNFAEENGLAQMLQALQLYRKTKHAKEIQSINLSRTLKFIKKITASWPRDCQIQNKIKYNSVKQKVNIIKIGQETEDLLQDAKEIPKENQNFSLMVILEEIYKIIKQNKADGDINYNIIDPQEFFQSLQTQQRILSQSISKKLNKSKDAKKK